MGLGHSPRIVTENLVLALDAGNPKNYNAGISTNWTDKVGGNNGTLVGGTHHNDGPFVGAGYVEFDGSGDYLTAGSASDWTFVHNGSSFTAECWFNTASTSGITLLSTSGTQTNPGFIIHINEGSAGVVRVTIYKGTLGTLNVTSSASSFSVNTWNHVAAVYNSSTTTLTLYINGVSAGTADGSSFAFSSSDSSFTLAIGRYQLATPGGYFNGYISNVRLVNGTALYTSNFTPPTGPLTAVTNTVLLTCQGNTITDASSSAHTITANGNAAARLGFPASAFEFDGTNDYVSIADSADLRLGTGTFTIEAWIYPHTVSPTFNSPIVVKGSSSAAATWQFDISNSSKLRLQYDASSSISSSSSLVANVWTHVAVVREGTGTNETKLYINGVLDTTGTVASDFSTTDIMKIGHNRDGTTYYNGYISNVRIYKGKGLTAQEVQQNYNALKGRYV